MISHYNHFLVVRKGTAGFTPDRILSHHRTYKAAQRAFDRVNGPAVLIGPDGSTLDNQII